VKIIISIIDRGNNKKEWEEYVDQGPHDRCPITFAGTPAIMEYAGILCVTTLPAAMTQPSPIVIPGSIIALHAIQTSRPMATGFRSYPCKRISVDFSLYEWFWEYMVTLGPIKVPSPMVTPPPALIMQCLLMETLSPICSCDGLSICIPSQILTFFPRLNGSTAFLMQHPIFPGIEDVSFISHKIISYLNIFFCKNHSDENSCPRRPQDNEKGE
jgi:hypothetical protein